MCVACDREQAKIALGYIKGYFETIPALAAMVVSVSVDSVELSNSVVIEVHSNSYRSVRGRSIIACIFDEVAFFRSENSASPDFELHGAVTPGLGRMPGSMLILISTAHKRSGLLYQRFKDCFGKDDDDTLVVKGTTAQFNPLFDAKVIAKALRDDPQLYGAEYNSEWRDDLATFVSRELLEASVDVGCVVRPPRQGVTYHAFCDPSGGANDSMTLGIAHRERVKTEGEADTDIALLDCLLEIKAPFNPDTATGDIAALLKTYGIYKATSDRYAAQWPVAAFARNGVTLTHSERDRSQIYADALPLFASGRAKLIDNPRLIAQFAALERRTFPTGKERIDHGSQGHDDMCNAAAGALVLAAGQASRAELFAALGRSHLTPLIWDRSIAAERDFVRSTTRKILKGENHMRRSTDVTAEVPPVTVQKPKIEPGVALEGGTVRVKPTMPATPSTPTVERFAETKAPSLGFELPDRVPAQQIHADSQRYGMANKRR